MPNTSLTILDVILEISPQATQQEVRDAYKKCDSPHYVDRLVF